MIRLATLTTHPIQYHSPWYRALQASGELEIEVLYGHTATPQDQARAGFGVEFDWDVPLLDGYPSRFLRNASADPSLHGFWGIDLPEIHEVLHRGGFDAVLVHGWHYKGAWQAIRAARRLRLPVMVRGDSHLRTPRGRATRLAKWIPYRKMIPRFDACLAVGRWSREYFLHYRAAPERVFTVPYALEDSWKTQVEQARKQNTAGLRRRWELKEGIPVVLFSGKFVEVKRPLDFLETLHRALAYGLRLQALMVGDGPLRRKCEDLVRKERLPVAFAGFLNQSEIMGAYAVSDLLLFPSLHETWGMSVQEALASGLVCLVSDRVGCAPDLIREQENGSTFPVGDVKTAARLLSEWCSGERLAAGRAQALNSLQGHSLQRSVEALLEAVSLVSKEAERRNSRWQHSQA